MLGTVRMSLFTDTQAVADSERGHCPLFRQNQSQCGQECPRSEKSEMRTFRNWQGDYGLGKQIKVEYY